MGNWIEIKEGCEVPKLKEKYGYSERVLVWYEGIPNKTVEGYGIAYYHPEAPFGGIKWVDFANYGRMPKAWHPLPEPFIK